MKIKERKEFLSKPKPMTCSPEHTVREAVALMAQKNYGAIIVVDDAGKVLGLVTERDLMRRLINEGRDPETTKVREIMTSDVKVAEADDEIVPWLQMMSNERFRRLPIVDESGKLINIMTQGDFISYTWPDLIQNATMMARGSLSRGYIIALIAGAVLLYIVGTGLVVSLLSGR